MDTAPEVMSCSSRVTGTGPGRMPAGTVQTRVLALNICVYACNFVFSVPVAQRGGQQRTQRAILAPV